MKPFINMTKVLITSESRFPVDRDKVRQAVEEFLSRQKIKNEVEVSISVVGDRKMKNLNRQYRKLDHTTPVLTFSLEDQANEKQTTTLFITPPDKVLYLGDIVISYPQTVLMATQENKLVDQKMGELVQHGLGNLFGLNQ